MLNSYRDSGGLWRMGHEFNGGRWALNDTTARHPATITVSEHDEHLILVIAGTLDDRPTQLAVEVNVADPVIVVRTSVAPPPRRTVTLSTSVPERISSLMMHQPGGVVHRELQRWYDPTFWPLHSFAAVLPEDRAGRASAPLVIAAADPTAFHATAAGTTETVVARTATKEIAFGVVPVLAPAWGRNWGTQTATVAIQRQVGVDPATTIDLGRRLSLRANRAVGRREPRWLLEVDDPLIEVITVKAAHRGHGFVARLRNWAADGPPRQVNLRVAPQLNATIDMAWRTDSNERDHGDLAVHAGGVTMTIDRYITSVRLTIRPAGSYDNEAAPQQRHNQSEQH